MKYIISGKGLLHRLTINLIGEDKEIIEDIIRNCPLAILSAYYERIKKHKYNSHLQDIDFIFHIYMATSMPRWLYIKLLQHISK
jgi:hypothetical protein